MVHPTRRNPLRALLRGALLAALLLAGPAQAGEFPPPSNVLQHPRNQVLVATFVERVTDGRYRFSTVQDLRGPDTAPTDLLVRAPDWLAGQLSRDENYLLAYSTYIGNPRLPKDFLVDTDGPRLLLTIGLEPALFRDSAPLRAALLHPLDEQTLRSADYASQVRAGLLSADPQLQNFYAAELTQQGVLSERDDPALRAAVETLLRNPDGHPSARAGLLRLVAARPATYDKSLVTEVVNQVLAEAPIAGYQELKPQPGELVRLALDLIERDALDVPLARLVRLVSCDSAPLAEGALLAIRRIEPDQEQNIARQALTLSLLSATTREFLLDHLRRLELSSKPSLQ